LVGPLKPFLKAKGYTLTEDAWIEGVLNTLRERSKTLLDMADDAFFYFSDDIQYEEKAAQKFLKPPALEGLNLLIDRLAQLAQFDEKALEGVFLAVMETTGLKLGKIAQPVRVALTGKTASPGIFEIIEVLGKDRVIARLKKAVQFVLDQEKQQ
ncbi:MAG: glutamate--tRNA ligase, partial [Pseudomonadota bacterium]